MRTLELKRAAPDFAADEHYHPASLLCGETGPLLVAFRLAPIPCSRTTSRRWSARTWTTRPTNGRGRYSLWKGDVGTALYAAACLDVDARYPILDAV